jgi:hypothetical protein
MIISRSIGWVGHVAQMGDEKFIKMSGKKIPLGELRRRLGDTIKMNLK